MRPGRRKSLLVAVSALFGALTTLFTVVLTVYIPETRGYFNLGEAGVYLSAVVLPPPWAALAAGLGSALADVILGYYIYAPATLVIKAAEAFAASLLLRRLSGAKMGKAPGLAASLAIPSLMAIIGTTFYSGSTEVYLTPTGSTLTLSISALVWLAAALTFAAYLVWATLREVGTPQTLLSLSAGGALMVLGYFLYEQAVLGVAAIAEVPFNTMQVLVGVTVASLAEKRLRTLRIS
ncbi:MAG: ECF transporter S component [Thermofilum sp.]|nr:ECF transporter S component [Thermofilum sp.]